MVQLWRELHWNMILTLSYSLYRGVFILAVVVTSLYGFLSEEMSDNIMKPSLWPVNTVQTVSGIWPWVIGQLSWQIRAFAIFVLINKSFSQRMSNAQCSCGRTRRSSSNYKSWLRERKIILVWRNRAEQKNHWPDRVCLSKTSEVPYRCHWCINPCFCCLRSMVCHRWRHPASFQKSVRSVDGSAVHKGWLVGGIMRHMENKKMNSWNEDGHVLRWFYHWQVQERLTFIDDRFPSVELALVRQVVEVTTLDVSESGCVLRTRRHLTDHIPPSFS